MNLRDNILIQPNAIAAAELEALARYVQSARMEQTAVSNFAEDAPEEGVEWVVNKEIRDTHHLHQTPTIVRKLRSVLKAGISSFIEPFYDVKIRDWEPLQLLHYGEGGHYIPHVDAETLYTDEAGLELWEKTLDRDISVVYFLNDDFDGGELFFPNLDLLIQPAAGTLICFPSDHNYIHGVKPVTSGRRYSVVTWMRVKGMPSVEEINQRSMDEYHRVRPKQLEQPPRVRRQSWASRK
jgi:predicted 2-oxoglutarate/Fe(II)-dependent dioxygenase YbiX